MPDVKTKNFYVSQFTDSGSSKGISICRLDGSDIHYKELQQLVFVVAACVETVVETYHKTKQE